jgi:23S rRNA (adenine2503-C2)-methyltransferase
VGCAFCATGAGDFRRNLSAAEIVDQVRIAAALSTESGSRLSNVVYMGMGEPLLNLRAVLASIKILTDPLGLKLGHRSLAVSTVGIPAGIIRLAQEEPQVNLALSLHAASDEVRERLIPNSHRHPLKDVLAAAWKHFELTRRKLLVEYVLLRGLNDSPEDARRLAALLRGHVVTVNLLAWNPVNVPPTLRRGAAGPAAGATRSASAPPRKDSRTFSPSPREAVVAFRDALRARGIEVSVRQSKGADIEGACGQLAGRQRSYAP